MKPKCLVARMIVVLLTLSSLADWGKGSCWILSYYHLQPLHEVFGKSLVGGWPSGLTLQTFSCLHWVSYISHSSNADMYNLGHLAGWGAGMEQISNPMTIGLLHLGNWSETQFSVYVWKINCLLNREIQTMWLKKAKIYQIFKFKIQGKLARTTL